jgi:hypothetical protein
MKVRALRTLTFVTVAALTSACNDSTAPRRQPADLDEVITEMTVPSLAATLVPGMPATPSAAAITPSSCSYDAVSQRFNCPSVTVSGVTFYRWFSLLNAGGTPQSQFNAATTDGVHLSSSMASSVTANSKELVIAGNEDLTLRGLLSGVHTLSGTTLLNLNGTDAATGYPFVLSISSTIDDLVLPDTPADRWPKSGSVIVHATHAMAGTTTTSQLSATFNGTSKVDVSLTSGGVTLSCTVDLASQHPTCGS